ncbi:cytochrome P450 [Mycena galericulata]|nr:cytochrome P450 [Mycena galericulata]
MLDSWDSLRNSGPVLALGLAASLVIYQLNKGRSSKLPPGPRGLPLLGNIADLPKSHSWETYAKWGEKYGGIVHIVVTGTNIIVLNDAEYAISMLDKKSRLYSDRPTLTMAGSLVGWEEGPSLAPFGEAWSEYRRLFSQYMGSRSKIVAFEPVLQKQTREFLEQIIQDPSAWVDKCHKFAATVVLLLAYGYKPTESDDRLITLINDALAQWSEMTASNAFAVDVLPILRYVPEWFPFAGWKQKIPGYRKTLQDMLNWPYDWVGEQMAAGTARESFLFDHLQSKHNVVSAEEEKMLKWAAAGIYAGGSDSTVASLESFILALTMHPSAQKKAQAEIDRVVGTDRLPNFGDRENLPYVEGLYLEVMRANPIGPLGLPHVLVQDDIHNGYFIPKGSIIFTNVWQFFKDPRTYESPYEFRPERFITTETHTKEKDPRDHLFGFGRRICPGIHLADATLWLACVSILAAFDIQAPLKDGVAQIPPGNYLDGAISHPEPFDCVIKLRPEVEDIFSRS